MFVIFSGTFLHLRRLVPIFYCNLWLVGVRPKNCCSRLQKNSNCPLCPIIGHSQHHQTNIFHNLPLTSLLLFSKTSTPWPLPPPPLPAPTPPPHPGPACRTRGHRCGPRRRRHCANVAGMVGMPLSPHSPPAVVPWWSLPPTGGRRRRRRQRRGTSSASR